MRSVKLAVLQDGETDKASIVVNPDGSVTAWHGLLFAVGQSPCLMPTHACATCPASAYVTIQTEIRDEAALVAALTEMGYHPLTGGARHLTGYKGDTRAQIAHVVIPRAQLGSAANDVGWERTSDGTYRAHISEYDGRSTFTKAKQDELKRRYTVAALAKKGYCIAAGNPAKAEKVEMRRF